MNNKNNNAPPVSGMLILVLVLTIVILTGLLFWTSKLKREALEPCSGVVEGTLEDGTKYQMSTCRVVD